MVGDPASRAGKQPYSRGDQRSAPPPGQGPTTGQFHLDNRGGAFGFPGSWTRSLQKKGMSKRTNAKRPALPRLGRKSEIRMSKSETSTKHEYTKRFGH